jgi:SsrA-binding protein
VNIFNKKSKFDYQLLGEGVEAGISLKGAEAKSIREGRGDISKSFVKIVGNEAFLVNANIPVSSIANYDSTRTRKLLLHKSEILSLLTKMKQRKLQIVPLKLYNKGRLVKLYLELGKPKREFEKREAIKKKDIDRDIERELKNSF